MRGHAAIVVGGALAAVAAASSCGDVPTLAGGIAYITFTLPSPAVGVSDVLRDSLGNPAPLRIRAFDPSGAEVPVASAAWISTPVPVGNGVTIDANGLVKAADTTASVQVVGRIGDQLQTTPATLLVVPQPDSIAATAPSDTINTSTLPALDTMRITVTGLYKGARTLVQGVIVRYRIEGVFPASAPGYAVLTNAAGVVPRPDSTIVVDTTKNSTGGSSAVLVASGSALDSVVVRVRASRFNGRPLGGSPIRFVLRRRP